MSQNAGYSERGYVVLPLPSQLPSGRYGASFEIYEGAIAGHPVFSQSNPDPSFATEMQARTYIQAEATKWIEDNPLK